MATERLTINGLSVSYDIEGIGPTILLIHGWAGSRLHWRKASPYLPHHRIVAPDLFGFGDSEEFELGATGDDYLRFIRSLLANLGVENCTVVGHSMGGQVAARLAGESQTPVSGLVLVEAPVSDELRNIKCPILLVFGEENDERTAIASAQRSQSSRAEVVFIKNAGHNVMLDQPAEFYNAIEKWLSVYEQHGLP